MRRKKLIIIFSILCSFACIILLSSVVFSVQKIYADCEGGDTVYVDGMTIDELVLASHNFTKGESIFLADKKSAAACIESKIPNVKVKSIKKMFPNRIYIYYEILFDYFEIYDGGQFYILSDDCKITDIRKLSQDSEKIIHVYLDGEIGTPSSGEYLSSTKSGETNVLSEILFSLKRLDQSYDEITRMFEFIDIRGSHGYIYMKTTTGVYFRLTSWKNIAVQMQWALSVYRENISYRSGGTITVSDISEPAYSLEVYYNAN